MALVDTIASQLAREGARGPELALRAGRLLEIEAPWASRSVVNDVLDRVDGLGPLQALLEDSEITDILVNGPHEIWVERGGELERTARAFESTASLMATVERAISPLGLRIDALSPMVDGRLPDGSRIHVAIPPAVVGHPVIAIRRFSPAVRRLEELVEAGTVSKQQAEALARAVTARRNIIIAGGTGAGKTTLMNVLAASVPPTERIVTVEDAAELDFPGHVVRLEARPPNAEGFGEITIRQLLRSALRLRPDRIVLGEVRGPEALDLVTALNTGHSGSMSTVHANTPEEALWRLETLALLDGAASSEAIRRQLHASIDLVVQVERTSGGRRVSSVCHVDQDGSVEAIDD